ncbi:hypothetical protein GOEFS_017_00245 [Gordonia effusa NBRC 100432]|uniref:Transposase n=1 Tax=Gordonia effusa NBRC 100432 TaxID=1077974 RepID=H0QVQ7_9ACTN|nr:hypothetical protein GOEFS_017_00245 [Gordonia effusa NBRC 100432]
MRIVVRVTARSRAGTCTFRQPEGDMPFRLVRRCATLTTISGIGPIVACRPLVCTGALRRDPQPVGLRRRLLRNCTHRSCFRRQTTPQTVGSGAFAGSTPPSPPQPPAKPEPHQVPATATITETRSRQNPPRSPTLPQTSTRQTHLKNHDRRPGTKD